MTWVSSEASGRCRAAAARRVGFDGLAGPLGGGDGIGSPVA
jgi:hypothetical protein